MTSTIFVSRDSIGVRVTLGADRDAGVFKELGPYALVENGNEFVFTPCPEAVIHECAMNGFDQDIQGLRFSTWPRKVVKEQRFGPVRVEADIYNPAGFVAVLPDLHERPWPVLRRNDSFDVEEQLVLSVAERINDLADFCGMPHQDAVRQMSRRIPPEMRRFLPRDATVLVKDKMASLRLHSASA